MTCAYCSRHARSIRYGMSVCDDKACTTRVADYGRLLIHALGVIASKTGAPHTGDQLQWLSLP